MKVKTSVTLSPETLQAIDEIAGELLNRSRVIEQAVLEFVERRRRAARDAKDLEILNRSADALNEEVEDILGRRKRIGVDGVMAGSRAELQNCSPFDK